MYRVLSVLAVLFLAAILRAQTTDAQIEQLYAQAKAAQSHGDMAAAILKYEAILKIAPKVAPAYNNLGALYFTQREYQKAVTILTKGLDLDPGMASASALLGISLYQTGAYGQARPRLQAVVHSNPRDNVAQMYLAKTLLKLKEYDAAAAVLKELAARQPRDQEIWYLLARAYMKLSEDSLAHMNSIDPSSIWAHELSGEVMESMNNYDGAIVEFKKAVEIAPRQSGVHYKLGNAYWSQSQWDAAAEQFDAELKADPSNCAARWKLGNIGLQKNGDVQQALAYLDQALAQCPGLTEALPDRGRALMKLSRNEEAAVDLAKAVQANPSEAGNHFLLAKAYRAIGKTREAQSEMQVFSQMDEAARAATAERAREVIQNKQSER